MKNLFGLRAPIAVTASGALAMLVGLGAGPALAASGADFYKGKTVTYVVATSPGGGHIIGANLIYNSKANGLTIGIFNTGLIYSQVIGKKGIRFDLAKMSWIGKAAADPRVVLAAINGGPKTLAELKGPKVWKFASGGVGSSAYNDTQMLGKVLGWKYRNILGYRGTQTELAMRRGEIHASLGSLSSAELFVKNGYGRLLTVIGGAPITSASRWR